MQNTSISPISHGFDDSRGSIGTIPVPGEIAVLFAPWTEKGAAVAMVDPVTLSCWVTPALFRDLRLRSTVSLATAMGYRIIPEVRDMADISKRNAGRFSDEADTDGSSSEQQAQAVSLFKDAAKERASDVHIVTRTDTGQKVFFRIDGDLEERDKYQKPYAAGLRFVRAIYNAMTTEGSNQFRADGKLDGRIAKREFLPDAVEALRVSSVGTNNAGHSMTLRLLYNTSGETDFKTLGYSDSQCEQLNTLCTKTTGCIIISGPTGSGKSTTLKTLLTRVITLAKGTKNVITVEDPCEYPIEGARQTSVHNAETFEERERAYERAIVSAMRHDPDVIMVGEIRDTPSALLAVDGAKTGHLICASLHASSALAVPSRLRGLKVTDQDAFSPDIVSAMICQRLVKRLCPHCRKPFKKESSGFTAKQFAAFKRVFPEPDKLYVTGKGCSRCRKGVTGRTVVAEIIVADETFMALIARGERLAALSYWKEKLGGQTMREHAVSKAKAGLIDPVAAAGEFGFLETATVSAALPGTSAVKPPMPKRDASGKFVSGRTA